MPRVPRPQATKDIDALFMPAACAIAQELVTQARSATDCGARRAARRLARRCGEWILQYSRKVRSISRDEPFARLRPTGRIFVGDEMSCDAPRRRIQDRSDGTTLLEILGLRSLAKPRNCCPNIILSKSIPSELARVWRRCFQPSLSSGIFYILNLLPSRTIA